MLFLCLIIIKIKNKRTVLYDFDSKSTLPLRGLLAIFIVFHHASQKCVLTTGNTFDRILFMPIDAFHTIGAPVVAVFFFLTGYGLAKSLKSNGRRYLRGFVPKRLGKILPEFLILTFLFIIIKDFVETVSIEEIVERMKDGYPPLPASWFIYVILYTYLAFYFSAKISKAELVKTGILFTGLTIVGIIVVFILRFGGWWYISTPSIITGYWIAVYEKRITPLMVKFNFIFDIAVCMIIGLSLLNSRIIDVLIINTVPILTYMIMRYLSFPQYKLLVFIGFISLEVYLVHGAILKFMIQYEVFQKFHPYISSLLLITVSILVAYGITKIRNLFERRTYHSNIK